jgi:hypothetical protein
MWAEHVAGMVDMRNLYKISVEEIFKEESAY